MFRKGPRSVLGIHAVLGLRGYGKSRLARAIVADATQLIVIDTLWEHEGLGEAVDCEGLQSVLSRNPESYRLRVHTSTEPEQGRAECEWLERVAAARPGSTLFIDEIDYWYTGAQERPGEGILSVVRYGRHFDQTLVAVARRPQAMSKEITSQATLWVYPMQEVRDRDYVRRLSGFDPGDLSVIVERDGMILQCELARVGIRGVEVGVFNLETGQYRF